MTTSLTVAQISAQTLLSVGSKDIKDSLGWEDTSPRGSWANVELHPSLSREHSYHGYYTLEGSGPGASSAKTSAGICR